MDQLWLVLLGLLTKQAYRQRSRRAGGVMQMALCTLRTAMSFGVS